MKKNIGPINCMGPMIFSKLLEPLIQINICYLRIGRFCLGLLLMDIIFDVLYLSIARLNRLPS